MRKKIIAVTTTLLMLLMLIPSATSAADSLTGLTLEKEMRAMIEKGIIKGWGGDDYRPKGEVTREQFAGFLARTLDLSATPTTFTDVNPSKALAPSIGAIQQTGIMTGTTDNRFMPEKVITREEMALTMYRAIKYENLQSEVKDIKFADENKFTLTGGLDAAKLLSSIGVMTGGNNLFNPKNVSTRDQVAAVLYRFIQFKENAEAPVEPPTTDPAPPTQPEPPQVDPTVYQIATVSNGQLTATSTSYDTWEAAEKAFNSNSNVRAILKNNDVIKIKSGRAFGAKNPKNYTSIYSNTGLTNEITYVQHGREMQYVGSGPNYAIVMIGGTTGYAKHNEVDLVPTELVVGKEYYMNDGGILRHYTYDHLSKKSAGSYTNGPAPSFMVPGVEYTSYDGVHFYDASNNLKGSYYPYFQFNSVRTATDYSAEQLDQYIMSQLQYRAQYYPKYADAPTKSKLVGLGQKIKNLESQYKINAMFIVSVAIHESDYGMSSKAQACNNLFGIAAYDASTKLCERSFPTPEASAEAFILDFMNKNYVNALGRYANGAVPGNKSTGVNVKYASDPNWGSKVAGHMYSMDQFLGSLEYGKHIRGMTNVENTSVNVRKTPQGELLFSYKPRDLGTNNAFGYPVVIVETVRHSDGYDWYKVYADINPPADFGWIRADLINKIDK